MEKLKTSFGLILMAFLCAYTVNGISQNTSPEKRVVIVKKTIENGIEKVERTEYNSDEMSDDEFKKMIEAEENDIDIKAWNTKDGKEMEITIGQDEGNSAFINESMEAFLKEKGIKAEDIANLNINVDSSIEDGKEIYKKEITVEDKNGKVQVFVIEGDELHAEELNGVHLNPAQKPKLGVMISAADEGVLVEEVIEGSPANNAGILKDDVIIAIGESHVKSINDLIAAMEKTENQTIITLLRNNERIAMKVPLTDFEYEGPSMKKKVVKKYEIKNN